MNHLDDKFWILIEWFRKCFAYSAVLRPSYFFGMVIILLPLSKFNDAVPMLGNLFVEYGFWQGLWFGLALSGAVWAVMLTTCLTLDFARDRQENTKDAWIPDPGKEKRWVSVPMRRPLTFYLFSLLGAPALIIVVYHAANGILTSLGLIFGCFMSYGAMSLTSYLVQAGNERYHVFPWKPFGLTPDREAGWVAKLLNPLFSRVMKFFLVPDEIFRPTKDGPGLLKEDHFFAALSGLTVTVIYVFIYFLFKPSSWFRVTLDNLPPAGFIYALLLPIIWIVSALWSYLSRYRMALYFALGMSLVAYFVATRPPIENLIGGPTHTYDVFAKQRTSFLQPDSLLSSLRKGGHKNLIIVAASGGGILAAGWTAQVLTELHIAYPQFSKELRLISSVSGGSVGTAHYVSALPHLSGLDDNAKQTILREIARDAMRSSLASTAYGVAFPDFKRALFPFFADETFDRARLLESDWRKTANCRRSSIKNNIQPANFLFFCRDIETKTQQTLDYLSDWSQTIDKGDRPAVIFNTTVMETGERIAITPLKTLRNKWSGLTRSNDKPYPERHVYARTLSEFLNADVAGGKNSTCPQFGDEYDIDVWTGARLSATFSYVSPAARAACFAGNRRNAAAANSRGLLHLIDGGYHDNYGVASAFDWLGAAIDELQDQSLPVDRIAFVEIRAKRDIPKENPQNEWSSAWLGPVWGLLNSWGFTQTSSNDTAVNRAQASIDDAGNFQIATLKSRLKEMEVELRSFVFVPEWKGPLSWHLSEDDKKNLCNAWWSEPDNQAVLQDLLSFLNGKKPKKQAEPVGTSSNSAQRICEKFEK